MATQPLTKKQYLLLCEKLDGRDLLLLQLAVQRELRPTDLCRLQGLTTARYRQLAKKWAVLLGINPAALSPSSIRKSKAYWHALKVERLRALLVILTHM